MAANQVGERFGCLSVTLEQPFKDCFANPDAACGWSPQRALRLGASALDAVAAVAPLVKLSELAFNEAELPAWTMPGYTPLKATELSWGESGRRVGNL